MTTEQQNDRSPLTVPAGGKLRYPAIVEMLILGALALVLMIGLAMIRSLVSERSKRANEVRADIASSWGQQQTVGGPVLIVPFVNRYVDQYGKPQVVKERARFLPERLKATGQLHPTRRHRGIYDVVLYRANLTVEAVFAQPDFSMWNIPPEDVLWNEAVLTMGISDLRGIRGNPAFQWSGKALELSGGTGDAKLWQSGLSAPVVLSAAAAGTKYPFAFNLDLNGSEEIYFLPLGGETIVELKSPWPDPSFGGAYLPETPAISQKGFSARWSISSVARSFPQQWRDTGEDNQAAIAASAFGVGLFSPISHYQKTERSMKYGALFIILTFLTFFLYELLSPVTLHPVQYFLVGGALCLFYLLLLSFSEHTPFGTAYAIASIGTIALISCYGIALLRSAARVLGLTAVLAMLYGYLYVLLQLEDWALLMGSIGLFLIVALVMYTTRRVDWGAAHVGRAKQVEA
ncbi:MAG TPA: cell envelope integrity protein CreD [Thermoanaerobaculia bacterium]|nr:cell envelope integrity protein CreD [Thermoanaerobaculia bacterium]